MIDADLFVVVVGSQEELSAKKLLLTAADCC